MRNLLQMLEHEKQTMYLLSSHTHQHSHIQVILENTIICINNYCFNFFNFHISVEILHIPCFLSDTNALKTNTC